MDLLLQAIVGIWVFVCFYILWIAKAKSDAKGKEAPEPAGAWPVIGHLNLLDRPVHLVRTLGTMADKYGPAFTLWLGTRRTLVVSSMEMAKECFTTNDLVLATRHNSAAGKHMLYEHAGFGVAPYRPLWREIRKISTLELLSNGRLEMLKHVRATEVDTHIKKLYWLWVKNHHNPIKVELKHWFEELAFNLVTKMISGKRYFGMSSSFDDDKARRFVKALGDLLYLFGVFPLSDVVPYVKWIDCQGYERAMKRTAKELDFLLVSWVEEHRRKRLFGGSEGEKDFIDVMLLVLKDSPLSGLDHDTVIKSTSLILILGATDTTSVTLTWVISLL